MRAAVWYILSKIIVDYIIDLMLASSKKTLNNSTVATSKSTVAKQKETFFAFVFRKIREAFARVYLFSRRCLWVSSTGTRRPS